MCNCESENQNNSGFLFGLVIGAIISAFVAIYLYKNSQNEVFQKLKRKLEEYFSDFIKVKTKKELKPKTNKVSKISVVIPDNIELLDLKPTPRRKPVKMFKK